MPPLGGGGAVKYPVNPSLQDKIEAAVANVTASMN